MTRDALRHPGNARPGATRGGVDGGLAGAGRARAARAPAFADPGRHGRGPMKSRAALAKLPVTRKHELQERQQAARASDPFGGFSILVRARPAMRARCAFRLPRPDLRTRHWRAPTTGAGPRDVRRGLSQRRPGAQRLQLPHDAGRRDHRIRRARPGLHRVPRRHRPDRAAAAGHRGTAARRLCGHAQLPAHPGGEGGGGRQRHPSLRKALVGGEAFPPSLRDWFTERGIDAYQTYATADLGLIAYETAAREGLVVDEGVLLEIVRPGTGDPVAEGEVGEVVVTAQPRLPAGALRHRRPLGRAAGACPTGRTNTRIRGWLGRADQTTKIRGMFVHPGQVAEVVRRFPGDREGAAGRRAAKWPTTVMTLKVEAAHAEGLDARVADAMRDVTKLRGEVECLRRAACPTTAR